MKKSIAGIALLAGLFLVSSDLFAQISTPDRRKFNIGLSAGMSIKKFRPMAALDISYKSATIRLMPNYKYYSIGYTQEIMKVSPVFYNIYWTGSIYGAYGIETDERPSISLNEYDIKVYTLIVSTGLKSYFGKRLYTNVMVGIAYNRRITDFLDTKETQIQPYGEFTFGVLLFKTYPHLKREETEE